jgi:peptidoglycan/LPS O-acetylase OafA/YrhL
MIHLAAEFIGDYQEHRVATITLSFIFMAVMALALHALVERPFLKIRSKLLERYF